MRMKPLDEIKYLFIVHTDSYSGNFERAMCGFLTGTVGECGKGEEEAKLYRKEGLKPLNTLSVPDEHGCCRPCTITPTPDMYNNGLGFHYKKGEEAIALEEYKKFEREGHADHIKHMKDVIEKLKRGESYANWTIDACKEDIKRHEKTLEKTEKMTEVHEYPAYCSVAIFFEKKPRKKVIEMMKQRAYLFAAEYDSNGWRYDDSSINFKRTKGIRITGFEIEKETTVVSTKKEKI